VAGSRFGIQNDILLSSAGSSIVISAFHRFQFPQGLFQDWKDLDSMLQAFGFSLIVLQFAAKQSSENIFC